MQSSPPESGTTARRSALGANRRLLVVVVAAVSVISVTAVAILLLQSETLQIEATKLVMATDTPQAGMTQLRVSLVLQNVGRATVRLQWMTLFANGPNNGPLFDTFTRQDIQLEPGGTRTFSEVTNVTGLWHGAAFTVKLFPVDAPSWESPLVPNQPVTWTS